MGPTFSVISMRPSGRNARRHGRLKVATWVMTNGKLASGFCAPRLVWAEAPVAARAASTAVFANFIFDRLHHVAVCPAPKGELALARLLAALRCKSSSVDIARRSQHVAM